MTSPGGAMSGSSSSSSLFASAHPLLPPPLATLDVAAPPSSTKLWLPGPDGGSLAARDAGPRLAPLVPGTNLNVAPPAWALASDFRPYTLFPHSAAAQDDAPDARGASRPPDFIAAAENLKKLFAMPFSGAPVSLAVQRLGPTLLLDSAEHVSAALRARVAGAGAGAGADARPGLGASPQAAVPRYLAAARRAAASESPKAAVPAPPAAPRRGSQQLLEAKLLFHALSVDARVRELEASEHSASDADSDAPRPATPPPPSAAADALVLWSSPAEAAAAARDAAGDDEGISHGGALQRRVAGVAAAQPGPPPASAETRWAPPRAAPGAWDTGNQLFEWQLDDLRLVVDSSLLLFRSACPLMS
jgi:hypothetical protein